MLGSMQWPCASLADHVDLLAGYAFSSLNFTSNKDDIFLVKGADVQQGYIDWDNCVHWPVSGAELLDKYGLEENDVILAMDRPWVPAGLKWAWISKNNPKCMLVQRVARMRGICGLLTQYLRYIIGSQDFSNYIKPIVTGVNVPHISGSQILGYKFRIPPLKYQEYVVSILSAFDDLVDNNNRRINVLEEVVRIMFREMYSTVYPNDNNDRLSQTNAAGLEMGWRSLCLDDIVVLIREKYVESVHCNLPLLDMARMGRGTLSVRDFGDPCELTSSRTVFQKNDILFGSIRPYLHKVSVAPCSGVTNTSVFIIRRRGHCPLSLLAALLSASETIRWADKQSTGTKMPVIKWEQLRHMQVILPPMHILKKYESIMDPNIQMIESLSMQNMILRKLRNHILLLLVEK